jgi:carbamate kinase
VPYASLYERPFSREGAVAEHRRLEEILRDEFHVRAISVREAITAAADTSPAFRDRLVQQSRERIAFTGNGAERRFAALEFEKTLRAHDLGHFFDILMTNPAICVRGGPGGREIDRAITARQPLSNLYFLRDQQAVCGDRVIPGKMAKPQRSGEMILVALGGNAILRHTGTGTAEEQLGNIGKTTRHLAELVKNGHAITITHGNGPQEGDILLANECAKSLLPQIPLDLCGAESIGMIGYMIQQSMNNELALVGIDRPVVTVLTQTLVDATDPAFRSPTKPIGPFYIALEAAKYRAERGWVIEDDSGRGFRRLVPSPYPPGCLSRPAPYASSLMQGSLLLPGGGGGIPVVRTTTGAIRGVEAVIDKDRSAALLASATGADILLILTDVKKISLHYGTKNQEDLDRVTLSELTRYMHDGPFAPGSMKPKVEAAIAFIRSGGSRVIVTRPDLGFAAIEGETGTEIVPDPGSPG